MDEISVKWLPVPTFPGYEASNEGQIRSWRRSPNKPNILKGNPDKDGYIKLTLGYNKKNIYVRKSYLIALAWIGPRPEGLKVCHKNGKNQDDRPDNLQYKTQKENIQDKYEHKTMMLGEKNHRTIFTQEQVIDIYQSNEPTLHIVKRLNLKGRGGIDSIRYNKSWVHLTSSLIKGSPPYLPFGKTPKSK